MGRPHELIRAQLCRPRLYASQLPASDGNAEYNIWTYSPTHINSPCRDLSRHYASITSLPLPSYIPFSFSYLISFITSMSFYLGHSIAYPSLKSFYILLPFALHVIILPSLHLLINLIPPSQPSTISIIYHVSVSREVSSFHRVAKRGLDFNTGRRLSDLSFLFCFFLSMYRVIDSLSNCLVDRDCLLD